MVKAIHSFRSKMVLLFGVSMIFAGAITFAIFKMLQFYYYTTKFEDPTTKIRYFMREVGDINFFLIIFIPLSILFFFIVTRRYSLYFHEISNGINQLANGNFNSKVYIPSTDEFGNIASNINLASEQLRQALERGDFAESSKDQLVLNLAHDLRTPLTSVLGYLDFILQDEQLTTEQIKHYAAIAFTKSQHLEKLVDELFEITRMNYGKITIDEKMIDVSELLVQLNEEMYPAFEKSNLAVRMNMAPQLVIRGDGDLLARVFTNILINACRYGSDGKFVDINGYREAGEVVIEIINYGDPIPKEIQSLIFDMFFTGDRARTQRSESSGLGLFIAKNIVEQHKGSIAVRSDLIRTQFEVRLPCDFVTKSSSGAHT
ncbi:two-component sensor histidine kinase [Paenibacillus montaniterrae]|uniref:histidine kinase n=1 Tax=Paenibacillus montaniterrae TaxID=429341 RepID=A0A919YPE0_9BACL|nr:HAMP domain-containing sensor histidine kinase [Paenibacillus montaniterrae]GIP15829.1 two-component sensor histidine kinase [Paenibacillus montaniterrae]